MGKSNFVHLHVHSDYSLLDGACRIDRLLERAKQLNMSAIALTEHGNLFGIPSFYKMAKKKGIKPILGCEVYLNFEGSRLEKRRESETGSLKLTHMGLLAQTWTGYQNLSKIVSDAHVNGFYYKPRTDIEMLAKHSEGLLSLSGCLNGAIAQYLMREEESKATEALKRLLDIFGRERFFIELQDHGMPEQSALNPKLIALAKKFDVRLVATNDVHYVMPSDWEAHDALLCIQTGTKLQDENRMRMPTRQFYLKSREEMLQVFGEIPEAIENTNLVPDMCDVALPFGQNCYPVFPLPEEIKIKFSSNKEFFRDLCIQGLWERYKINFETGSGPDVFDYSPEALIKRLKFEWETIEKMGFVDYFLIVWDFINWAKTQGIPVGPGRGSVAGSLVAYLMRITETDPIRFSLLFERFLNPERVSPPDIDIDFCMRRREEVLGKKKKKYGKDNVGNIITFGTLGAKMVVRDLARVHDVPYADADRLAKMIPDDLKITLEDAVQKSSELHHAIESSPIAKKIIEQGQVLEGMVRNVGTHAAGMLISDKPLIETLPVTLQEGVLTTQYSKDFVEELGMLKMDFLGLKTLTVIDDAQKFIRNSTSQKRFNINTIPFDDSITFKMLNEGKTIGVFQLEAPFVQKICKQFEITSIDEISALSALNRPGPMEWIPEYIKGKKNPEEISYVHPLLEPVSKKTYGILVFQEQVMEAARVIAGYTLAGADILRRAMGKKKVEEMNAQRKIFVEGAWEHNGIDSAKAEEIFNILSKFAGYGFNKSHSDAYAIIIYQTAYLKANFPVQFMAALLSSELGNAEKLSFLLEECKHMGIQVLGPDVNHSLEAFTPIVTSGKNSGEIRFGLAAIKGVGDVAAKHILEEKTRHGNFLGFFDFAKRVDSKVSNKRVMECLIKAGAFDAFGEDRQMLLSDLEKNLKEASSLQSDKNKGQISLFDFEEISNANGNGSVNSSVQKMPLYEKLKYEKELLGFYLSGHPLDDLNGLQRVFQTFTKEELVLVPNGEAFRLCGVVEDVQKRISKKTNRPWIAFTLSNKTELYNLQFFPETFDAFGEIIQPRNVILVEGNIRKTADNVQLNIARAYDFKKSFSSFIEVYHWILKPVTEAEDFLKKLEQHLQAVEGNADLKVSFHLNPNYALEGTLPFCCKTNFTLEQLKKFHNHPAVYGLELKAKDVPDYRQFARNRNGNNGRS